MTYHTCHDLSLPVFAENFSCKCVCFSEMWDVLLLNCAIDLVKLRTIYTVYRTVSKYILYLESTCKIVYVVIVGV